MTFPIGRPAGRPMRRHTGRPWVIPSLSEKTTLTGYPCDDPNPVPNPWAAYDLVEYPRVRL